MTVCRAPRAVRDRGGGTGARVSPTRMNSSAGPMGSAWRPENWAKFVGRFEQTQKVIGGSLMGAYLLEVGGSRTRDYQSQTGIPQPVRPSTARGHRRGEPTPAARSRVVREACLGWTSRWREPPTRGT